MAICYGLLQFMSYLAPCSLVVYRVGGSGTKHVGPISPRGSGTKHVGTRLTTLASQVHNKSTNIGFKFKTYV